MSFFIFLLVSVIPICILTFCLGRADRLANGRFTLIRSLLKELDQLHKELKECRAERDLFESRFRTVDQSADTLSIQLSESRTTEERVQLYNVDLSADLHNTRQTLANEKEFTMAVVKAAREVITELQAEQRRLNDGIEQMKKQRADTDFLVRKQAATIDKLEADRSADWKASSKKSIKERE